MQDPSDMRRGMKSLDQRLTYVDHILAHVGSLHTDAVIFIRHETLQIRTRGFGLRGIHTPRRHSVQMTCLCKTIYICGCIYIFLQTWYDFSLIIAAWSFFARAVVINAWSAINICYTIETLYICIYINTFSPTENMRMDNTLYVNKLATLWLRTSYSPLNNNYAPPVAPLRSTQWPYRTVINNVLPLYKQGYCCESRPRDTTCWRRHNAEHSRS